jgi:hypothetical protein
VDSLRVSLLSLALPGIDCLLQRLKGTGSGSEA